MDGSAFLTRMQPLAEDIARRYAPVDSDERADLVQFAMYELHLASRKVGELRKPYSFARMVLQHAMMSMVRRAAKRRQIGLETSDAPALANDVAASNATEDELALQEYFTALERAHGMLARNIAENLCSPWDERLCRFLVDEAATRALRAGTQRPRNVKRLRITRHKVRIGLGVSKGEWTRQMHAIKGFTREWLAAAS